MLEYTIEMTAGYLTTKDLILRRKETTIASQFSGDYTTTTVSLLTVVVVSVAFFKF